MDNRRVNLDDLITETLKSIHSQALHDGLANSHRTFDPSKGKKYSTFRNVSKAPLHKTSVFSVAASVLLVIGVSFSILASMQTGPNKVTKNLQSSANTSQNNVITTAENPQFQVTTSIPPNSGTLYNPTPNPLTITPTTALQVTTTTTAASPAVDQMVRVSYTNTRANDIALDGATVSGNVYIFIKDTDIGSAIWWLDQPGVWDKNFKTRAGTKQPIDFNYRVQPEAVVPNPYDTGTLSVGEHTLGIETRSISTGKYHRTTIKFYVTR